MTLIKWNIEKPSDKERKEGYPCSEAEEVREKRSRNREREMNSCLTKRRAKKQKATMVKTLSNQELAERPKWRPNDEKTTYNLSHKGNRGGHFRQTTNTKAEKTKKPHRHYYHRE
ncbi:hypothetical protein TorRG33x02_160100 [Trema orientale]|uniref:Uncharacterized protein n=1 Tax=Trema orientale TaxID=63057 RepID=A0A2P5ERM1_TREOI|nr:hypothetical protein TorRG33x02_160100 [Trema orientale]